ncbi:MAG: LysM peptidoglycan-binding domain-containing protein [Planctomycetota bacterium]
MSVEVAQEKKRSRKVLVFWAAAMVLLAMVVIFSTFFAGPAFQARRLAGRVAGKELAPADAVEDLGGPGAAARRMRLVLAMPDWTLPAGDEGVGVRAAAVRILEAAVARGAGASDAPASPLAVLRRAAGGDRDPLIRTLALNAMIDTSKVAPRDVQSALGDPGAEVRLQAVRAAHLLDMVTALVQALDDPNPAVRKGACRALTTRNNRRATGVLIEMLSSGDYWDARPAERQLERWYHARFRGEGPGQSWSSTAVAAAWKGWWERNRGHIDRQFTLPVREGDTLSAIAAHVYARRLTGWSLEEKWRAILAANPGVDPHRLRIGSELVIPLNPDKPPPARSTTTP